LVDGKEIARSKAEERQQKLSEIRRNRRKQLSIIAVVAIVVLLGSFQLLRSGLFNVKKTEISGSKFVAPVKIIEVCGVNENTNLLRVPTKELRKKILKDPWVKDVTIKRALPSTLRIEIVERVPVALLSHGGKFYLVDENLFVVAERQYADDMTVPTITDLTIEKVKVGDMLINDSLVNAISCLNSMEPSFRKTINLISASSIDKLSLYNKDNVEILYGEAKPAVDKNKVLQTILKEQGRQVILVDIRNYPQSDPVIKRIDSVP